MNTHRFLLSLLLGVLPGTCLLGQSAGNEAPETGKSFKKSYFTPSVSVNVLHYTDFATSPLAYLGTGFDGALGWFWDTGRREHLLDFNVMTGAALALAPVSDYYPVNTSSVVVGFGLYDHHLFRVFQPLLPSFLDVRFGGALSSTTFYRSNSSLNNNGNGIESLLNLMAAGKISLDISRNEEWIFGAWLFQLRFKPVERFLSFQCNVGLLNLNYRPGYAYNGDGEINGSDTNTLLYILDSHRWSLNGWRLNARLEYTRFRPSGNGYKLAYVWDAAFAPGRHEHFQIASHRLQYTLFINLY